MQNKIFLICPVRVFLLTDGEPKPDTILTEAEKREKTAIMTCVKKLENDGNEVYWPMRDTDQTDTHGWTICARNRSAIIDADEIHVWYDASSVGSKFDLGIVFGIIGAGWPKRVVIANPEAIKPTPKKSFENVLLKLQEETERIFKMRTATQKSAKHTSYL